MVTNVPLPPTAPGAQPPGHAPPPNLADIDVPARPTAPAAPPPGAVGDASAAGSAAGTGAAATARGAPTATALIVMWVVGIVLLPVLKSILDAFDVPPQVVIAGWVPVLFVLIVGTVRACCGHDLGLRSIVPCSLLTIPAGVVVMLVLGFGAELFGGKGQYFLLPGFLLGFMIVTAAFCSHAIGSRHRRWVYEVGGQKLGEPDMPREKHVAFTYLMLAMFGIFGAHRYYLGWFTSAVIYNLTLGLAFIGVFVDFFLAPRLTRKANERIWLRWFKRPQGEWVTVEGTARDVGGSQWQSFESKGGAVRRSAMQFRVEELDENGDIVRRVPVEVVGISFTGSLRDGDTVKLTGKRSAENIVRTLAVDNVSTGSKVVASFL